MAADVPDKGSPHDRARIVRRYLSALDARKPGRTNARTAESVLHRIHQIDTLLLSSDPVQRLHLTQERIDLHAEQLRLTTAHGDFDQLEKSFTRVARLYGDRHDITYSAWRQVGVDAGVLSRAGIIQAPKASRPPQAAPAANGTDAPAKYKPAAAKSEPAKPEAAKPAEPEPAKSEPAKQEPAKKAAAAKKVAKAPAAAKKAAPAKKTAPAKKAADKPEQQRFPAEAHLLS